MDLPPVHPGPAEDQILVLQSDHRSSYVWEGHLLDQTLRARRPGDLWDFLKQRHFHPRVVERLEATGFLTIFRIGRMQLDWSLITTLIERWRPETHTFHLPTGEAIITLEDVQVLYGLRVDGLAVALPQPQGEAALRGGSRVSMTAIREHMEVLHPDITGEIEAIHIERYTRLALLLLFGGVLFPNTSGNLEYVPGEHGQPGGHMWISAASIVDNIFEYFVHYSEFYMFIWTPYNDELLAQLPDYS
uniref:Serine/threonine-protein phosphatase 7 long form homolog n=1 Tax=Nicotiana tabacum TaxID=4097 RepID=A0A1S3X101_TOBAC|nr:PREDICTED: serine/threonine-protein phosphatase 7 long form homolog [Nicotiana tabacum]